MADLLKVKAGRCFPAQNDPKRIVPSETPGNITLQLNAEDDLLHFIWTPRKGHTAEDTFDLIVFPGEATFIPYTHDTASTTGRIYVLKFSSSSQRYFFWWQTKAEGGTSEHSQADKLVAKRIDKLLQSGGDLDSIMDDDALIAELDGQGMDLDDQEQSRQGGADGGRAAHEISSPQSTVDAGAGSEQSQADFLQSLLRGITVPNQASLQQHRQPSSVLSLPALLPPSITTPLLESAELRKKLLENLPPTLTADIKTEGQEKELLRRVLHSPQFTQAAVGLTVALREGGLRGVADSLGVQLDLTSQQGGVEMFLDGVKKEAEKEKEGDEDAPMADA